MDLQKCAKCHNPTRLSQLIHCCSPNILVCNSCQRKFKCNICTNSYSDHKKCPLNCKCILPKVKRGVGLSTPQKKCASCSLSISYCICKAGLRNSSKFKPIEKLRCTNCYQVVPVIDIFFTIACNHHLCSNCYKPNMAKCYCGKQI